MPKNVALPDLTIPEVARGRGETIWDLTRWLYIGAAGAQLKTVYAEIRAGRWGTLQTSRLEVVQAIHDAIKSKLASGGSPATGRTQVATINSLVAWADERGLLLNVESIAHIYLQWTDWLIHRMQVVKDLKAASVYTIGRVAGQVLDLALERPTPLIMTTRLKEPKTRRKLNGIQADKQNLEQTFAFGRFLQDICDGVTLDALWGPVPLQIPLSGGNELIHHCGRQTPRNEPSQKKSHVNRAAARRAAFDNDKSLRTRYPLANLRICAEMLMFIAQTGMNLAQANRATLQHFSYSSDVDGYKVRDYKARRGGEVLFEIFKEYRSHFERYLTWRRSVFPDDLRLFPLVRFSAYDSSRPCFEPILLACKQAGIRWVPPGSLRKTRVNWLLRRSGDLDLTSDMVQHWKQTLLRSYEEPSLQRAIVEVTRFWQQADPHLASTQPVMPVAPGVCDGVPVSVSGKPDDATAPDCVHPSGCLWCEHHRDIDSLDYVWSLSCFRHLKILEVAQYHPPQSDTGKHPARHAIDRMSEKLAWFRDSNANRRAWVDESLARVEEGNYHPDWNRLIADMEGVTQ